MWTTPDVKTTKGWQKKYGDELESHLGTCGAEYSTQGNKIDFLCDQKLPRKYDGVQSKDLFHVWL